MDARQLFDPGDALLVTDGILRHRMRPACDVVKHRLGFETHEAVEIGARRVHNCLVAE